jgi:hypothetical protein
MDMPLQTMNIYKYCNTTSKSIRRGINPYNTPCAIRNILPLSKTSKLNTSTVESNQSKKMAYSRWVNTYGTPQNSAPALKTKTCAIGINRFTY